MKTARGFASGRGRHVTVLGTLNIDHVWRVARLPRAGETLFALGTGTAFGGKGAKQAVAAARQGTPVVMLGAVGADPGGAHYLHHLQGEAINTLWIATQRECATGTAHVYVDAHGENQIIVDRGANALVSPALIAPALQALLPSTSVLVTQLEGDVAAVKHALQLAAQHHVVTVCNASPVTADFDWGCESVDVVIVNDSECREFFRRTPEEFGVLDTAARQTFLGDHGIGRLIVTRGSADTLVFSTEEVLRVPTFAVQPVDTVGAGDTFAGVLAAQLATDAKWPAAVWRANVAAALSTLEVGAQTAMPRREAMEAALQRFAGNSDNVGGMPPPRERRDIASDVISPPATSMRSEGTPPTF